mmetsp:Transcript_45175/g.142217  ORF Transcript_45175/g.142217 Transcript_45175/m.142217 type:complete len:215 (-) Transcript_45175:360-1004(-)
MKEDQGACLAFFLPCLPASVHNSPRLFLSLFILLSSVLHLDGHSSYSRLHNPIVFHSYRDIILVVLKKSCATSSWLNFLNSPGTNSFDGESSHPMLPPFSSPVDFTSSLLIPLGSSSNVPIDSASFKMSNNPLVTASCALSVCSSYTISLPPSIFVFTSLSSSSFIASSSFIPSGLAGLRTSSRRFTCVRYLPTASLFLSKSASSQTWRRRSSL